MRSSVRVKRPRIMGMDAALFFRGRGGARSGVRLLAVALSVLVLTLAVPFAAAHDGLAARPAPSFAAEQRLSADNEAAAMSRDLAAVGFLSLPGLNADVWTHAGFAYVGTWGSEVGFPRTCPATGVRIVDLSDPRTPALVGAVATIAGTSQEDVAVAGVSTPAFQGDLLVTGVQACARASSAPRGLDLWDVSDPRNPQHLAFWSSSPAAGAAGVHELHLFQRGGRVYVAATVPFSEALDGQGDFRLVDVTDPRRPVQVSAWGARVGAGLTPGFGETYYAHGAYTNEAGTLVIVSYWDAGAILLDLADPARPRYLGRAPGSNTHSVWFAHGESVLVTADELSQPENGAWGYLHVWDVRNPAEPREIGWFATANAQAGRPGDELAYTIHNPFVRGTVAYLSWFSDGVRVVDLADPSAPREIAAFVPPATADPYRLFQAAPLVWGVHADQGIMVVSDINAGLYVLETVPPAAPRCFPETGQCVGGRFLDYWQEHGGLALNGYPISDEFVEVLEDGRSHLVQYFERVRLEYHPENAWPYDVLLGQFGRRLHPADPPAAPLPGAVYFAETGHNLGGGFLTYWRRHGGLAQFGYPISEEFTERLEDGQEYTVQYFERARFEYHPENPPPYDVLLGLFGQRMLEARADTVRSSQFAVRSSRLAGRARQQPSPV